MKRIKRNVSRTLDIATDKLNEISLGDIEIEQAFQHRIYMALHEMTQRCDIHSATPDPEGGHCGIPCTGFWVADTRELVLFAWSRYKTRTIVVPAEEWFLREDITVH
ncbi:MAG: hypothetical protein KQI78_19930 [Deltaproteobacteria bacterium]|nr:hypothetical protein [Deltaproteobacteria bacterium]